MKNHQIAKNNMYNKMLAFFAVPANAAVWAAFARLVTEIANFVSLKGALDLFIQQQGLDTKGITSGKTADFNAMIDLIVQMANKAFVWAVDTNNANLIELFDVQHDNFDGQAEETAFAKVMNIRNAINTNIGSMASVDLTAADVLALDALISAYNLSKGQPGIAQDHKETGTKSVADQMHNLDASLNLISRLLISKYSSTNSGMVNDFKLDKHIHDLPTHHSGIHLHITDSATGNDIEGAILSIPAAGKTAASDMNGIAEIIKIKNGDYHVSVTAPGYVPETFKTTIVRGKVSSFSIKMSTAASGGGGGGVSTIREGDVPFPGIVSVPLNGINGTPQTTLTILMTLSPGRVYAGATVNDIPGPVGTFLDFQVGTPVTQLADALVALIGLGPTKPLLLIQNIGMVPGHYKITFDNLQSK